MIMLEQMLIKAVKEVPSRTAIAYGELKVSYEDLYFKIKSLSKGFSSMGVSQGDCVAVLLPNCPEFVFSFYAIAKLNAIVLPLNHLFKEEEISYYIGDSNVKAIITDGARLELCCNIVCELNQTIEIIVIDSINSSAKYLYDLIGSEVAESFDTAFQFEGDVLYQYSSGSTGRPKKVGRTQYNLYHEVQNFTETVNVTSADSILCLVPFYHAHGLGNCLLAATCNGATLVILDQVFQNGRPLEVPFVFRRPKVLELIEREKVTILPAVPYIFNTLAETPAENEADLSTLRLCFSAGNFLPKDVFHKFLDRFKLPIRQAYGCTESGSIAINLDKEPENTYDSVGFPMKNVEVKIIDDEGNELPPGLTGQIVIKSQAMTGGYHNMPKLNQQVFIQAGYLTGDLGRKDELGRLYITGRKKILIDTGGRKVDPLEVEDILVTHPKVKEAVIVGVKGPFAGEIVKAVIVQATKERFEKEEIIFFCQERMAEFKVPKIIEFRDEIPKSPLGKTLRKELI
jgi:long-chain acyl-CoA synthetase